MCSSWYNNWVNITLFVSVADRYNSRRYRRPLSFFTDIQFILLLAYDKNYYSLLYNTVTTTGVTQYSTVQSQPKFQIEIEHKIYQKKFSGSSGMSEPHGGLLYFYTVCSNNVSLTFRTKFMLPSSRWLNLIQMWLGGEYVSIIYRRFKGFRPA